MKSLDVVVNSLKNIPKGVLYAAKAVTGISIYEAYTAGKSTETPTGHASDGHGLHSIIGIGALYTGHMLLTLSRIFDVDMTYYSYPVGDAATLIGYYMAAQTMVLEMGLLHYSRKPYQLPLGDDL